MDDKVEALERLSRLRGSGDLTQDEFQALKAEVINAVEPSPQIGAELKRRSQKNVGQIERSGRVRALSLSPADGWRYWTPRVFVGIGALGWIKNAYLATAGTDGILPLSVFDPLIWLGVWGLVWLTSLRETILWLLGLIGVTVVVILPFM